MGNEKIGMPYETVVGVRQAARRIRREYLTYEEAEIVYSLSHKTLYHLATEAGAIYRNPNGRTVLIKRDILDEYLEKFHEPPRTVVYDPRKNKRCRE